MEVSDNETSMIYYISPLLIPTQHDLLNLYIILFNSPLFHSLWGLYNSHTRPKKIVEGRVCMHQHVPCSVIHSCTWSTLLKPKTPFYSNIFNRTHWLLKSLLQYSGGHLVKSVTWRKCFKKLIVLTVQQCMKYSPFLLNFFVQKYNL